MSALCYSVLGQLARRLPGFEWTVFDYGRGTRSSILRFPGHEVRYSLCGLYETRRVYRAESLALASVATRLGAWMSPGLSRLKASIAMLDVSGGDSFTDLYGTRRFREMCSLKRLSLASGAALVLLPQTYGPFQQGNHWSIAAAIVKRASCCWARDARSFDILRQLLGPSYDPARHRLGVDVAFLLEAIEPDSFVARSSIATSGHPRSDPRVGLNISGLIHNDPEKARTGYRFIADYRETMSRITRRLVADGAIVMLVPHVVTPRGHYESDTTAAESVLAGLSRAEQERVTIAPEFTDPREAKWLIARCDWFCGTRMHATIAALSSGVPTAAVAYSDKTLGVFESCGQGEEVVDPRLCDTDEVVQHLWSSYTRRDAIRASLAQRLPAVVAKANEQMDEIAAFCTRAAEGRHTAAPNSRAVTF